MKSIEDVIKQAGRVEVNLAPLLLIIGSAATALNDSPTDVGDYVDLLFLPIAEDAADGGN